MIASSYSFFSRLITKLPKGSKLARLFWCTLPYDIRPSSLSILALSFKVLSGILYFFESILSILVNEFLSLCIVLRIRSWLSFKVLKINLRRSVTPLEDIGVDTRSFPSHSPRFIYLSLLDRNTCPLGNPKTYIS